MPNHKIQFPRPQTPINTKIDEGAEANVAFVKSHTEQVLADMLAAPAHSMI